MLLFSKTLVCTGVKMPQWWTEEKESEPYLGSIFLVWCPLQSKKKSNHALLHSAQSLRNPALRYEITLYTTIHLYSPTSHSDTLCSSILPPVTEPSTASFLKGIHFRWANLAAGWISFIRAQHKGIRCNVPARFFFLEDLCVFFQAVLWHELMHFTWVPVKWFRFYKTGSLLLALRYRAKAFLRRSQKRAFTRETGFSACYYTPH